MFTISNNLIELNNQRQSRLTAATVLERLGFTIQGSGDITLDVALPDGWTHENKGQFHNVFYGPNGETVRSFIKYAPGDRHSFLQARNISEDILV